VCIAADDPRRDDVRALLEQHLRFAREASPPEHVHALDLDVLLDPAVSFFSARRDGALLAVGALKQLDSTHAEVKSMHTSAIARGQGVGRAMLLHLLRTAADRGNTRVSLETGTMDAFAAARSLYASAGFVACPPFGDYTVNPYSVTMTLVLAPVRTGAPSRSGVSRVRAAGAARQSARYVHPCCGVSPSDSFSPRRRSTG
jgi:putative acetyltransferase